MKKLLRVVFVGMLSAVLASNVYATSSLININFNKQNLTYTGPALIGSAGDKWNTFNAPSSQVYNRGKNYPAPWNQSISLIDSKGNNSGVSITSYFFNNINYVADGSEAFPVGSLGQTLMDGYAYTYVSNTTYVNLSGLTPGQNYRITVYSQAEMNKTNYQLNVKATGSGGVVSFSSIGQDMGNDQTFTNQHNYIQGFVTPTSTGTLALNFNAVGGSGTNYAPINGIQIEAVPEPRNVVFLGVGALLVGVYVRYKSKESVTVEL